MRNAIHQMLAAILTPLLAACYTPTSTPEPPSTDADALQMALEDEYKAQATYAAVIEKFGDVRPFSNIIQAERRHSDRVKVEMDRLGIAYAKENPLLGEVDAPASLLAACKEGVAAEQENIALYDKILPTIVDAQVLETLTALQRASRERHLPAFERCVERGGAMGGGMGRGGGR